jgi:hypothetical protein
MKLKINGMGRPLWLCDELPPVERPNPSCNAPPKANLTKLAYDIKEAATVLGMSEKSVRRQIARQNLRRCNKFGRIRIPRKDVETFFERHSA